MVDPQGRLSRKCEYYQAAGRSGRLAGQPAGPNLYPAYLDRSGQERLLAALRDIIRQAPLFPPRMPRTGSPFSVRMTNCGPLGWVSDVNGYRYQAAHPVTGKPWPPIPDLL